MNEQIYNLDNLKLPVDYLAYSEGEKKRIDISILLSFLYITKIICNWHCNILFIDELLDSAVDDYGLEKMVTSLKTLTHDNPNLCIYVISHRLQLDYAALFNNSIKINKNSNGFSNIDFC
jgi:ABC-type hemin transport system ATPase subunit